MTTRRWLVAAAAALAAILALMLASCGGGGSAVAVNGGVGTGGTGISTGTVTGFGSLVLDGTAYNSASPLYFASSDQQAQTQTASTAVGLGDRLEIRLDAQGRPTQVVIDPELIGPVANLGNGQFRVNGVAVHVNTNPAAGPVTYYAGLSGFADLSNGMQVEVHGAFGLDAFDQGYIQATRIEQLPANNPVTRVTGLISNLDAAAGRFQLGTLSVQFSANTPMTPAAQTLANGELVNVWSNTPLTADGVLSAGAITIRTLAGLSGPAQIGGLVAQRAGSRFTISGIPVDASTPRLASAVAGLSNGEYVVVQGQVDPNTGVLVASALRTYATSPAQIELRGTITGYVSPGNFLVRGVPVDASSPNTVFPAGSSASLRNGVFVDVVGYPAASSGNVVTAAQVTVLGQPPEGATVDYQGTVSAVNLAAGTFTLTAVDDGSTQILPVTLASNVVFSNGTPAQLVNGASVEVEALNTPGGLLAYSVSYQNVAGQSGGEGGNAGALETKGTLYNLTGSSFQVNGLTIQINGVTPKEGSLYNGAKVEVSFIQSNGLNLAQDISVDQ